MSTFEWIAVSIVTIISSARLTRLMTHDAFPPVKWLRRKYMEATVDSDWQKLGYCPYCMSFWMTLAVVLSGYYSEWHEVWWLVNTALSASYLAAIFVFYDGDDSEDES